MVKLALYHLLHCVDQGFRPKAPPLPIHSAYACTSTSSTPRKVRLVCSGKGTGM